MTAKFKCDKLIKKLSEVIFLNDESFNKVFIGSGLIAEIFLHALINHKGESPNDFYILGKDPERCERLKKKYQIRATTNFHAFVSKAKVIVLAVDVSDLDNIPSIVSDIADKVPADALINSVTPHLKIEQIEKYFPNHPVMRLSINFSAINGNSIGSYCCGSVNTENTASVARFLIESFGELMEVADEEEFEKVHDIIFAQNCSNYMAMNCFIKSAMKAGLTPQQARKIAVSTYSGAAETFSEKSKDDLLIRMFDFKEIFDEGVNLMEKFGIIDAIKKSHELSEETTQKKSDDRAEKAKYRFRYKSWE